MNILPSFFSRWKARMLWHVQFQRPFLNILRYDYISLYLLLFWAIPLYLFTRIDQLDQLKKEKELEEKNNQKVWNIRPIYFTKVKLLSKKLDTFYFCLFGKPHFECLRLLIFLLYESTNQKQTYTTFAVQIFY